MLLTLQISSINSAKEALNEQSQMALVIASRTFGLLNAGVRPAFPTCVCASVVLQVSSSGEPLATVRLLANEGLLAVVSPHVNLQPLQHVETLPAAFCAAPEHPVIPASRDKMTNKPRRLSCTCFVG